MKPAYFDEKRYSYHVFQWLPPFFDDYQAADPSTQFEKQVQQTFLQGNAYLQQEEYYLALNTFRQLQNLILTTVHPTLPADSYLNPGFRFPLDVNLLDSLTAKTGDVLTKLPLKSYTFPASAVSDAKVADSVAKALAPAEASGVTAGTQSKVRATVQQAGLLASNGDWAGAAGAFGDALKIVPDTDTAMRASLLHDQALAMEKAGKPKDAVIQTANQSATLFGQAEIFEAQVDALQTIAGMQTRAGQADAATKTLASADQIVKSQNLFHVGVEQPLRTAVSAPIAAGTAGRFTAATRTGVAGRLATSGVGVGAATSAATAPAGVAAAVSAAAEPQLLLDRYVATMQVQRTFQISGSAAPVSISLAGNVGQNVKGFLQTISATEDLGLLVGFGRSYVENIAYIPHMYFFVIPMVIGDCLVGMGNYSEAESYYTGTLVYPFINKKYEIVSLWAKLASLYLDMADLAYRNAKDSVADYASAKGIYEKIIKTDKTLDSASPLYADAKFASIKSRVAAFIAAGMNPAAADNPQVLTKVLEASVKLQQISLQYNYFGFLGTYIPPFSWQYLQNTAKYFAQQASQIEQRYIQFKSTAENETLQRTQLDQQAEVARQTVILEQRGLAEAQAGVAVANASLNYATVQRNNAVQTRDQFAAVRNQLLEYGVQEAWANAASVDKDDEVSLTMTGFSYYNPSGVRRSLVIQELEQRRTQISQDLEAKRLQRDVDASNAYIGVANAEKAQANARVDIANQRIAIARLQQRDAEENRDFLDLKEFSASLWYDLARSARRISQKYLDMATETAFLMERAYNAETERGLSVIRYDYSHSSTDQLMGADFLMLDIDSFTLDYITTRQSKRAPMKRVISMADAFPMAFQQLKTAGLCIFQTELTQFDRQSPGMYLCKLRNVELLFVGIDAGSIAGSLRNVGVSKFRDSAGNIVSRLYPADVMPISRYDLRQDALAFQVNPNELRLFEDNGIDTLWQLELPLATNEFDFNELLDVQLVLYYDGLFDSALESSVKAALPASGSGSRVISMRMSFPDELFYMKNNGEAQLTFDTSLFSRTQTKLVAKKLNLKVTGDAATSQGLTLRLTSQNNGGGPLVLKTDNKGQVAGATAGDPLFVLSGKPVLDQWTIAITAADNPALVKDGKLVLKGLTDLMVFFEYDFQYRS